MSERLMLEDSEKNDQEKISILERKRRIERIVSLVRELNESGEPLVFPGMDLESYSRSKAEEEEFPGFCTPIDELLLRFEREGIKLAVGYDPESGNVFVLPSGSDDIENDSILVEKLHSSGCQDDKLKELILLKSFIELKMDESGRWETGGLGSKDGDDLSQQRGIEQEEDSGKKLEELRIGFKTMDSESIRERVKNIEGIAFISPNEKVELILVAAGFKSIAEIQVTGDTWESQSGENPKNINTDEIKKIKKGVEKFGLVVEVGELEEEVISYKEDGDEEEKEKIRQKVMLYAAISDQDMKKYFEIIDSGDDGKMGEVYGFPQSAIEAYKKEQESPENQEKFLIPRHELPEEIKNQEESLFLTFMVAKDDVAGSMEIARKWAEKIKEISPEIYRQYVEYMKTVVNF